MGMRALPRHQPCGGATLGGQLGGRHLAWRDGDFALQHRHRHRLGTARQQLDDEGRAHGHHLLAARGHHEGARCIFGHFEQGLATFELQFALRCRCRVGRPSHCLRGAGLRDVIRRGHADDAGADDGH
jgi:hypothetical protein